MAEDLKYFIIIPAQNKPIVFILQMEYHSIQTFWLKTIVSLEDDFFSSENLELLPEE